MTATTSKLIVASRLGQVNLGPWSFGAGPALVSRAQTMVKAQATPHTASILTNAVVNHP
jgi:hypothetical protein